MTLKKKLYKIIYLFIFIIFLCDSLIFFKCLKKNIKNKNIELKRFFLF